MAKNNNLQDFLKDVADAIREKKGTDSKINAQDYHDEILSINTGEYGTPIYEPLTPLTIKTETSYAPPPYDDQGYNIYNEGGPTLTASNTISTGVDLTDYTTLTVVWDDVGSHNNYGEIYATIDLYNSIGEIFRIGDAAQSIYGSGVTIYNGKLVSEFDITNVTGVHNFEIVASALSASPYSGFQSKTCLKIYKMYIK